MRFLAFLPFASLAAGFVVPDENVLADIKEYGTELLENSRNAIDSAIEQVVSTGKQLDENIDKIGYDVDGWLAGSPFSDDNLDFFEDDGHPPHHPPPGHRPPPHHGKPPHGKPPHHGKPHHPPHHHKPNQTVYELISKSKYTTKLTQLINEYSDLVELLNGTKANYTIFAPTDKAFEKIPHHGKKPSKEILKKVLLYHISDEFYPAGRVLHSYTIPTLFEPKKLGHAQRLTVRFTLHGAAINWRSHIVAANIFGTNGVIHGIDNIIIPPPRVIDIISLLPGEFSTVALALSNTGLLEKFNDTSYPHSGGTFFAPSNFAFKKLGPKINAFLFSKYGEKYLKALLLYHTVVNQTLYTDKFFDDSEKDLADRPPPPYLHLDLPTQLGKPLAVDILRRGPFITIRLNGFSRVAIHDGVAWDGVIQVVSDVLIPPRKTGAEDVQWEGEELCVEDFKARFDSLLDDEENLEL